MGKLKFLIDNAPKAWSAIQKGAGKVGEYIKKQFKSFGSKDKEAKGNKEETPKAEDNKQQTFQPNPELKENWTEEIEIEREKAANQEVGRARGQTPGTLGKVENAPTSTPGKEFNTQEKLQEIEEKGGLEEEIEKRGAEAEKSYEERLGAKKIEEILEEGKTEEGKSWAEKVRPNEGSEFRSLEQEGNQAKAVNLLKEDSSAYFMPDGKNDKEILLDNDEKKQAVDLMGTKKENPKELLKDYEEQTPKDDYKIDAYKATIKNHEELKELEESNFSDDIHRDEMAVESMEEGTEMDMDAGDFDGD